MSRKKITELNIFSMRIIKVRNALSVKDFADQLGVTPAYIYDLEAGKKKKISKTLAELISTKFKINKHWLFTGEGPIYKEGEQPAAPVVAMDARSPAWKMCRQVERIVSEGDKKKIEAIKGMLKALDPGESPAEGGGEGTDEGAGPKADSA